MWRIVVLILVAIVALSIVGFVVQALKWLLWVALVLAAGAVVVGFVVDRTGGGGTPRR